MSAVVALMAGYGDTDRQRRKQQQKNGMWARSGPAKTLCRA